MVKYIALPATLPSGLNKEKTSVKYIALPATLPRRLNKLDARHCGSAASYMLYGLVSVCLSVSLSGAVCQRNNFENRFLFDEVEIKKIKWVVF